VSFVKSAAVTNTDVSIERVNLALYDSYVVTGPCQRAIVQSAKGAPFHTGIQAKLARKDIVLKHCA
jgi:hypothetical protein